MVFLMKCLPFLNTNDNDVIVSRDLLPRRKLLHFADWVEGGGLAGG